MATKRGGREGADKDEDEPPRYVRAGNALLAITEDVIYVGIAVLLAVSAGALLVSAVSGLLDLGGDRSASEVVLSVLDTLLLVFIVVELLFAVRVILGKREVIAEPFLVVGIIASIKEIIVLSVEAADEVGKGDAFRDSIVEVGVLGVLVLVLAVAAIMLRAKEREPQEGDNEARAEARRDGDALKVGQGDPSI
jgi:uncharacterized membrane protein (DUF373 family)